MCTKILNKILTLHSYFCLFLRLDVLLQENNSDSRATDGSNKKKFIKRKLKNKASTTSDTRKRLRRVDDSIDRQSKKARAQGKEGTGRKGRPIVAKTMKNPCYQSCRKSCSKKISDADRQKAFDEFWALSDKQKKWECLNYWIIIKKTASSSDIEAGAIIKETDIVYYDFRLPAGNSFISVCRTMFLNTLGNIAYNFFTHKLILIQKTIFKEAQASKIAPLFTKKYVMYRKLYSLK